MFDHHELQVLISGASVPVKIDDLRHHTNYSGEIVGDSTVQGASVSIDSLYHGGPGKAWGLKAWKVCWLNQG